MGVPLSAAVTLGLLFFLSVGLNEQVAEGCRCLPKQRQQQYCDSNTVIRAKITGMVTSTPSGNTYGISIIQTFKHVGRPVQFIHSYQGSCGISFDNEEYLLAGHVQNGVMEVNLCSLVMRWDSLSSVPVSEWLTVRSRPVLEDPVLVDPVEHPVLEDPVLVDPVLEHPV
ncbi:metalloproteinase inhibitor 2-like [Garra rufa]|uniref:metalloproteinase inhibitor 2-like n=1 Tax=Garra rufa TaxID=137080 RepID=UPI003CCEA40B